NLRSTEEVYPAVVADRAAVLDGLGKATSAALLIPVGGARQLTSVVRQRMSGEPAVSTVDARGRTHRMWLITEPHAQRELLDAAGRRRAAAQDRSRRGGEPVAGQGFAAGSGRAAGAAAGRVPAAAARRRRGDPHRAGAAGRRARRACRRPADAAQEHLLHPETAQRPADRAAGRTGSALMRMSNKKILIVVLTAVAGLA